MVKCGACGTAWTSSGLPLCPMCGAKVEIGAPAAAPVEPPSPPPEKAAPPKDVVRILNRVEARPEPPKKDPTLTALPVIEPPTPEPKRRPVLPEKPPSPPPKKSPDPASSALSDFGFDKIPVIPAPAAAPAKAVPESGGASWYCPLPPVPRVEPAPKPKPSVQVVKAQRSPRSIRPPAVIACTDATELVDASVLVGAIRPASRGKGLPAPARPLSAPLVLGIFALVTGVLLPLSVAWDSNRVFGILGLCLSGFL